MNHESLKDEAFTPAPLDDALSGDAPEPEAIEPVVTPEPEQAPKPIVDATAETPAEPDEPAAQPESWNYAAYKDEKSKRQTLERELEKERQQRAALEWQQKQAQPPAEMPDMFVDPDAYAAHIQQQAIGQVMPVVQTLQRQVAQQAHGAEKLDAATQWFNTLDPNHQTALNAHYGQSADPYGGLIAEFNKAEIAREIADPATLQAFRAWQSSQSGQAPQPQPAPQVPAAPAAPRPSQVQLTPSVMGSPSMAPRSGPQWAGPKTLSEILPE